MRYAGRATRAEPDAWAATLRPSARQAAAGAFSRMPSAAVLSLELMPGERLSERGLEPLTGASRTPVRAALTRL
jgi:hypothetical protein